MYLWPIKSNSIQQINFSDLDGYQSFEPSSAVRVFVTKCHSVLGRAYFTLAVGGAVKTRVFFMFSMFPQLLPLSCKVSHMGVYTCHGHDALHCGMAKTILAVVLAAEQGTQWARYDVGF